MKLTVTIKFVSPENGGRRNPVSNGYRPSIRSGRVNRLHDCVFNLPSHVQLEIERTYQNVQIELLRPSDAFAVQERCYIYESNRIVAEAIVTKITS